MDTESYEQFTYQKNQLGANTDLLKENTVVKILLYHGQPISMELPIFLELKVVETDPGIRGDTASGGNKPAVVETGAVIKVPLYLEAGEIIKVDTRSREYVERVR
jgi:elongation factor P